MKKSFLLLLCFSIIFNTVSSETYAVDDYAYMYHYMDERTEDRESLQSLAEAIYTRLDEACFDDVLSSGKEAYSQGKYEDSLKLYRNYFIEKMRKANAEYYPNYTPSSTSLMLLADVVCGKKSVEDYLAAYPEQTWVDDCLDAFGSPYVEREINWLGGIGKEGGSGYWGKGQEAFLSWIGMMGAAYYNSGGDKIYLDKFFEVVSDFSLNHYDKIKEYEMSDTTIPVRERDRRTWQWPGYHGNNERFSFISCSLIQFCKLLPAEGETGIPVLSSWDDIVKPFGKANPEYYDLIDHIKLVQLTVCLVEEMIAMLSDCYKADIASNQRNSGARSCVKALAMFSEFTHLQKIAESCSEYMTSPRFFYEDGTFLEQSFNYNDDEARSNKSVIDFYRSINENEQEWFKIILEYNDMYYKFRNAFLSNALCLPKIGNGGDQLNFSNIWESDTALNKHKESLDYTNDIVPPGYQSVYFPWGGYACLRSGWDIKNDMTLQTYNSETSGTGHISLIRNGLWLTAYGRPLIVSGEGALYGSSYLPESQRDEYDKWNEYFGETASRKGSTIIVNDDNQATTPIGETVRITTEGAPIVDARYHDSEYFDYVEGKYENGYIDGETGEQYDNVKHIRQNFYIEEAKLWIINDLIDNKNFTEENEYSQIWRFPTYSTQLGHYGFTNEEVVIDEDDYSIKTQDVGTVNLFMKQFSNEELNYKKYYGSKGEEDGDNIYRGWTANGIQGLRVASPDVYVRWKDSENNTLTSVMTVAMPSKTESIPYTSVVSLNNSEKNITGFRLTTTDNIAVTSLFSENSSSLEAAGISAKAKNLVLTENGSIIRGLVLDCENLYYNNVLKTDGVGNFEFIAEDGELTILNAIGTPSDFEWTEAGNSEFAIYSQTDKAIIDGINNAAELSEWLDDNAPLFNLYKERGLIHKNQIDFISQQLSKKLPFTSVAQLKESVYTADKEWIDSVLPLNLKYVEKTVDASLKLTFDIYKPWDVNNPEVYLVGYDNYGKLSKVISYKLMDGVEDKSLCIDNTSIKETSDFMNENTKEIRVFIWSEDAKLLPLSEDISLINN